MDAYGTSTATPLALMSRTLTAVIYTPTTQSDTIFNSISLGSLNTIMTLGTKLSVIEATTSATATSFVTVFAGSATISPTASLYHSENVSGSMSAENTPTSTIDNIPEPTTRLDPVPQYGSGVLAGISLGILVAMLAFLLIGCFWYRRHRSVQRSSHRPSIRSLISSRSRRKRDNGNVHATTSTSVPQCVNIEPLQFGGFMTEKRDWDSTSFTKKSTRSTKSLGEPGPAFDGVEVIPVKPGPAFFQNNNHNHPTQDPFTSNAVKVDFNTTIKVSDSGPRIKHHSAHSAMSSSTLESIDCLKHGSTEVVYVGKARTEDMHQARRNSFMPKVVDISPAETRSRSRSLSADGSFKSSMERSFHTGNSTKLAKHYDVNRWDYGVS